MIHGFKKETAPLSDEERKLVPKIMGILKKCVGEEHAKTNKDIRFLVNYKQKDNVRDVRMRKIINHIRRTGKLPLLVASAKGYYISNDIGQIEMYLMSLSQRTSAINAMARAVKSQLDKLKVAQNWVADKRSLRYRLRTTAAMTKGRRYKLIAVRNNKYYVVTNSGRVRGFAVSSFGSARTKPKLAF